MSLPAITFMDDDFKGIDPKYYDPMVTIVEVANFDVIEDTCLLGDFGQHIVLKDILATRIVNKSHNSL